MCAVYICLAITEKQLYQIIKEERQNPLELLGKANKNTRVDEKRKAFVQNGYSLPPTVNKNPISPVRVESGNFIAGGVK
jgi:hypothetical protein